MATLTKKTYPKYRFEGTGDDVSIAELDDEELAYHTIVDVKWLEDTVEVTLLYQSPQERKYRG
jgi:hypothetical protein